MRRVACRGPFSGVANRKASWASLKRCEELWICRCADSNTVRNLSPSPARTQQHMYSQMRHTFFVLCQVLLFPVASQEMTFILVTRNITLHMQKNLLFVFLLSIKNNVYIYNKRWCMTTICVILRYVYVMAFTCISSTFGSTKHC